MSCGHLSDAVVVLVVLVAMSEEVAPVVDTSATDAVTADGADIVVAIHIASGG